MNGFLIANKPTGITSSDMVFFVRKRLPRGTAVGHGGTLDPEASGVLPVCVGTATRLFDYIIDKEKTYEAEIRLGIVTDTQDATGTVLERNEVRTGREDILRVLPEFTGDIMQIPPMYSAIKRGGVALYKLARKGESVEIEPRPCRVHGIELGGETGEDRYRLTVRCGKGVYIRTLCHDIGRRLGCGAHMASLKRTKAGIFTLEDALSREEIDAAYQSGTLEERLLPLDAPLGHLPRADVVPANAAVHAVRNGNVLKPVWLKSAVAPAASVRIYLGERFAGIGEAREDGSVRFKCMLLRFED